MMPRTVWLLSAALLLMSCATPGRASPPPRRTSPPGVSEASPSTTAPVTTTAPSTTTVPPSTTPPPVFTFTVSEITPELRRRMTPTSWRAGCPVPFEELRYLRIGYWGFDGARHAGELVVHRDVVADVEAVFRRLFALRYPIRSMRLVDDFGGDDFASIEADNTSAFNCRSRTGSSTVWSRHAYGRAIDLDPIENPYVSAGGSVAHQASKTYVDRSNVRPGMVIAGDPVAAAFAARGWGWGGRWAPPIDYQHFSRDGR